MGTYNMLSAISFVANGEAERTLKAEKKERKKEKKRHRKASTTWMAPGREKHHKSLINQEPHHNCLCAHVGEKERAEAGWHTAAA